MEDMELVKKVAAAIETRNTDTISLAKRIIGFVKNTNGDDTESNVSDAYTPEQRRYASVQDEQATGIKKDPEVAYGNAPELNQGVQATEAQTLNQKERVDTPEELPKVDKRRKNTDNK